MHRPVPLPSSLVLALFALFALLAACAGTTERPLPPGAVAFHPSGAPLAPPELSAEARASHGARLSEARERWEGAQDDIEAWIWLGRRTAYLGRFPEAIAIYTEAIERFGEDPRLLRHRGHRYISTYRFDLAERDLARAARRIAERGGGDEIEPDGLPNARGIPLTTLASNVHYHLGLARFLRADYEGALEAYEAYARTTDLPDNLVAGTHWTYLTLRALGRHAEARALLTPIRPDLDIIENHGYHDACLAYRGDRDPDRLLTTYRARGGPQFASVAFGLALCYGHEGDPARSRALLEELSRAEPWNAFGTIAATTELSRR